MRPEQLLEGAIDFHTHVHLQDDEGEGTSESYDRVAGAFAKAMTPQSVASLDSYYSDLGARCVTFGVDSQTRTGQVMDPSNIDIAMSAQKTGSVIPFASIDPHRGEEGAEELQGLLGQGAVRGLKLHPISQNFSLDDACAVPLLELARDHGVPVVVHTGTTGVGAGEPGGGGLRLELGSPLQVDNAAARFPDLNFVMAHPGYPWDEVSIAVLQHKRNVWMDLSGWSLKRLSPNLVWHMKRGLQNKLLFGTDFPMIDPRTWAEQFLQLDVTPEVARRIMRDNAAELLQIEGGTA